MSTPLGAADSAVHPAGRRAARRESLLRAAGDEAGVGSLLVTGRANVLWLTGLDSSNAAVLLLPDRTVLATDARYETRATTLGDDLELLIDRRPELGLVRLAEECGQLTLGFDEEQLTVAERRTLARAVGEILPLVPVPGLPERHRARKDPAEVAGIRAACDIASIALADLVSGLRVGDTELQLARRLELLMAERGAEDRAFPTIVASGPNTAEAHHQPTRRQVRRGELLLIDFGARLDGYNSDCTRVFVVGDEPTGWQQRLFDVVNQAATAARACLTAGVEAAAVDAAARSVIGSAGWADGFGHGTGHGIGLDVHEAPSLSPAAEGRVLPGQVVTVEPGVYLPGRGGVRIEDVCAVGPDGIDVLTSAPRELSVIG